MNSEIPKSAESRGARGTLAGLALSMLLASLGTGIAHVGLPSLAQAFGASFQALQWVALAYLLALTCLVVGAGRLGDRFGRRRVLMAGLGLFTGASLLCATAPGLGWLIAARALQGAGAAAMTALTLTFVADTVPKARTGRAMGLLGTLSAVGTALGPSLGGLLLAGFGWPALFLVKLGPGLLALWCVHRYLPADRPVPELAEEACAGFDGPGTVLLALTLAAYALACSLGRFGLLNAALLALAGVAAMGFVRAEARAAAPLIRLETLREPQRAAGLLASALVATVMMAMLVVGPFHLSRALALDAAGVGLALSVGPLVAALAGVPSGRLVDRFGTSRMRAIGLGGTAFGCAVLAALPPLPGRAGIAGYVLPIALATAGYALFQAANNTAVLSDVAAAQRGVVAALLALSRNLGLISGAAAMGAVFARATAVRELTTATPAAIASGTRVTFGVAALLVIAAIGVVRRAARA